MSDDIGKAIDEIAASIPEEVWSEAEARTLHEIAVIAARHGYALVPEEPTGEIEAAGHAAFLANRGWDGIYRAVIATGRVK